jgi:alkylation response protein AidB-like acyl-CoA dehydrogenase
MGHYKSNLRDIEFNLFEVFGADRFLGHGPFAQLDTDAARDVLTAVQEIATGPFAESFVDADRNPPVFDPETHSVTLPQSLKDSYDALWAGEWWRLDLPEHLGGYGAPAMLRWALGEMMLGANPAAFLYMSGPGFARILDRLGTERDKKIAQRIIERGWTATMVLTEPDAGSDVGAGRTRAVRQDDGSWHLEGVKRFITSGEHDLTDNIIHLVLARPEGHGPGTKGLSLFAVPKFHFDLETGELRERNGVYVTNVEHKMGLKASTTCELTFGEREPAVGWLVGEVHDGIRQMFEVIEYARMMVGTKAIATLSTGYLTALDFAKTRVQGADLTQAADKTAPRVTILHHPDVRRMLMLQKSYAEGMRALVMYTASFQDTARLAKAGGEPDDLAERVNDLLLPVVKGVGSERSYELLALSLQTLGGSGYLQDYPIEQYIRDAKIDTLYEGTTSIQAQDLFFRKIVRDQGKALAYLAGEIQQTVDAEGGNGRLKEERALLGAALGDVQQMMGGLIGWLTAAQEDPRNVYKVGLNATRLLMSLGDLVIGWLLVRQAEVALAALDRGTGERDQAFYEGKVAACRFFAATVLPELHARFQVLQSTTLDLMDLPEEAF